MPRVQLKWAIITGEYPPQSGGVSDYTHLVAQSLAKAGDEVHVWAPACPKVPAQADGVVVHRLPRGFGLPAFAQMGRELDALAGSYRIFVQYVPHAFGWKAMNLPFCWWLSRRRAPVWVMFHEVVFPLRWWPLHHSLLAGVTRLMAAFVTRSAERVFISTPAWEPYVRPRLLAGKTAEWLPVPSTIGETIDPQQVQLVRNQLAGPRGILVGHFGTYGPHIFDRMQTTIPALLKADGHRRILFLGRGSGSFSQRLMAQDPSLQERIFAFDNLAADQMRTHLAACDLVLQPYPDGITTRRTSSMAALALGVPILTNTGALSEPFWRESGAVALAEEDSPESFLRAAEELLRHPEQRTEISRRAASLYRRRFALEHVVRSLRCVDSTEMANPSRSCSERSDTC